MTDHHHSRWVGVALVAGLALLAFEAAGQGTGAGAMFEGRPALAGAQAGQGAQAGPPQGGIGLQGNNGAQLNLRPPAVVREEQQATAGCNGPTAEAAARAACLPQAGDGRLGRRLANLGIEEPQQRDQL